MIKSFDFYFDFASPYAFLAHKQIRKVEIKNSMKVNYMPVLLGGLLKLTGIKANVDVPIKAKYMIRDCKLCAERNEIKFKFNNYFPISTVNLMRCAIMSEKKGFEKFPWSEEYTFKHSMKKSDYPLQKNLIRQALGESIPPLAMQRMVTSLLNDWN